MRKPTAIVAHSRGIISLCAECGTKNIPIKIYSCISIGDEPNLNFLKFRLISAAQTVFNIFLTFKNVMLTDFKIYF